MPAPLLTLAMVVVAAPAEQVPAPAPALVEAVVPAAATSAHSAASSAPVLIADAIAPGDPADVVVPAPAPAPEEEGEEEGEDIIVQARAHSAADPLEGVNVAAYGVITAVDEAVVGPVAHAYERGLPPTLRRILSNFFSNLREPIVALNYLLQLKPGKAVETLARFAINTTAGFGGLNDVARERPFNLPRRVNGFGNTLAYYGVGPGPFLVLPLVGATTLRDALGGGVDALTLPVTVGRPFNSIYYVAAAYTINSLDFRIEFDAQIRRNRDSSDPYVAMRDAYFARRTCEIDALHNRAQPECETILHPVPPPAQAPVPAPAQAPVPAPAQAEEIPNFP